MVREISCFNGNPKEEPTPPASRGDTPQSASSQLSPTLNLTREYTIAVQTHSYNEIWSRIHLSPETHPVEDHGGGDDDDGSDDGLRLSQVLQPSRESVHEALRHARPSTLTTLVSSYFNHSEHTSDLCLQLHHRILRARSIYAHLRHLLLDDFSSSHLTDSQIDSAFDLFLEFDRHENPFPSPTSHPNFHDMRRCFSQLKGSLDRRLRKSRSKVRLLHRATTGSALCFVGIAVGAAISAVAIAAHALVVLVATPLFPAFLPNNLTKKELSNVAQLDAAAKGTYVLNNDLDTIERLVARLHTAVEADKLLVRLGLERGKERYPIQEVAKQLRKNYHSFLHQLKDLEDHLCLCFVTVNRARSLLLQQILLSETYNS